MPEALAVLPIGWATERGAWEPDGLDGAMSFVLSLELAALVEIRVQLVVPPGQHAAALQLVPPTADGDGLILGALRPTITPERCLSG